MLQQQRCSLGCSTSGRQSPWALPRVTQRRPAAAAAQLARRPCSGLLLRDRAGLQVVEARRGRRGQSTDSASEEGSEGGSEGGSETGDDAVGSGAQVKRTKRRAAAQTTSSTPAADAAPAPTASSRAASEAAMPTVAATPAPAPLADSEFSSDSRMQVYMSRAAEAAPLAVGRGQQAAASVASGMWGDGGQRELYAQRRAELAAVLGVDVYKDKRAFVLPAECEEPQDAAGAAYAEALATYEWHRARREERERMEHLAFRSTHMQNETAVNRYACVRRVAGLMQDFENDDFLLEEKTPGHISPWSRAEILMAADFEDFNQFVAMNINSIIKQWPKEANEEELDMLDDALFTARGLQDDEQKGSSASGGMASFESDVRTRMQRMEREHELADRYLEGILPGLSLASLGAGFADDIFADEKGDAALDELAVSSEDGVDDPDGARLGSEDGDKDEPVPGAGEEAQGSAAAPKKKGRKAQAKAKDDE